MPKEKDLAALPLFLTRRQMVEHLNRNGLPFSQSTIDKLCAPSVGRGPKPAKWLGKKALYDPDSVLEWGRSLLTDKPNTISRPESVVATQKETAAA
jgi:hypothetical protein